MTRALAVEWAPIGIRVNAVAPTYVRTNFIAALTAQPDLVAAIERLIPSPADQNLCAQLRRPIDMMRQGWSTSLFQAAQL